MCLIAWRTDPGASVPLLLAANRDEYHGREALPLQRWAPDALGMVAEGAACHLIAGRDLRAGGTWLGLSHDGRRLRVAALTNRRDGRSAPPPPGTPSRGLLVTAALCARQDALDTVRQLAREGDGNAPPAGHAMQAMAGFNLIVLDVLAGSAAGGGRVAAACLAHPGTGSASEGCRRLEVGVHGISNGAIDDRWPKTRRLMSAVSQAGSSFAAGRAGDPEAAEAALFQALADRAHADDLDLPDTGVGLERERWLSPPFIVGDSYGTRCSTIVSVFADGRYRLHERRYDPAGEVIGASLETGALTR